VNEAYDEAVEDKASTERAGHGPPRPSEVKRMVSKASARFAKVAPRKARVIANLVRGKHVGEAIQLLQFTPKGAAAVVKQILDSAVANARQKGADVDALFISKATVDKGPNKFFRRWRPRAMGRATRVQKGISHIVIELDTHKD
jgi:large subunit ribosomal protein L22